MSATVMASITSSGYEKPKICVNAMTEETKVGDEITEIIYYCNETGEGEGYFQNFANILNFFLLVTSS